jgi:hypothetical protein
VGRESEDAAHATQARRSAVEPPDTLRMRVLLQRREHIAPDPAAGELWYRRVGSGRAALHSVTVTGGWCSLPAAADPPGTDTEDPDDPPKGILLVRLAMEDGRSAHPRSPFVALPADAPPPVALFVQAEHWEVQAFDALTGLAIGDVEVRRSPAGPWTGLEGLTPPVGAKPVPLPSSGVLIVDPVVERADTLWLGGRGYCWFPYRVQRRHELGHAAFLDPAADLRIECRDAPQATLRAALLSTERRTFGETLGSWTARATGALETGPLRPGEYLLSVAVSGGGTPTDTVTNRVVSIGPGETEVIVVSGHSALSSLSVTVTGDLSGLSASDGALSPYRRFGGHGFTRERRVAAPVSASLGESEFTATWPDLAAGEYVLALGPFTWIVEVEEGRENRFEHSLPEPARTDILFVDGQTGEPATVSFVRWTLLLTRGAFSSGSLIPSEAAAAPGGGLSVFLPPGELRLLYGGEFGVRYAAFDLIEEQTVYTVAVAPSHELLIGAGREPDATMARGGVFDLRFRKAGVLLGAERIHYGFEGTSPQARATMVFVDGAPDEVYIPSSLEFAAHGGTWQAIPWEGAARLAYELEAGEFSRP